MYIETERLLLRQWKPSDNKPFSQMCSDENVMKYFPARLSEAESDSVIKRCKNHIDEHGWGFWAIEEKRSGDFIGFTGLNYPPYDLPFSPCIEIGWRLAYSAWGNGYATEAAYACLDFAFKQLKADRVVAFSTVKNIRSQNVMRRIGMHRLEHSDFDHPGVQDTSLKRHCLYEVTSASFKN